MAHIRVPNLNFPLRDLLVDRRQRSSVTRRNKNTKNFHRKNNHRKKNCRPAAGNQGNAHVAEDGTGLWFDDEEEEQHPGMGRFRGPHESGDRRFSPHPIAAQPGNKDKTRHHIPDVDKAIFAWDVEKSVFQGQLETDVVTEFDVALVKYCSDDGKNWRKATWREEASAELKPGEDVFKEVKRCFEMRGSRLPLNTTHTIHYQCMSKGNQVRRCLDERLLAHTIRLANGDKYQACLNDYYSIE